LTEKCSGKDYFTIFASWISAIFLFLSGITACELRNGKDRPTGGIHTAPEAIATVQAQYKEVSNIKPNLTPEPFVPDRVIVNDYGNRWDIIFSTGSGDCPSGCLNNYYWYFSVWPDGKIEKVGEYSRVFVPSTDSYEEEGVPLWGIPR
jgi:hypothetical protein